MSGEAAALFRPTSSPTSGSTSLQTLQEQFCKNNADIAAIEPAAHLESWREEYEVYFASHKLALPERDENYLTELIKSGNEHHQSNLLYRGGFATITECGCVISTSRCSCECGHRYVWREFGFDPLNVTLFNIYSTRPFGVVERVRIR